MSIKYLDFDLLIERSGTGYAARVLESPAGEASVEFKVPFSQSDVEDFFIQIGHTRSFETPQIKKMHEFGQLLFEAAFHGEVRDRLRASLSEVNRQGAGLRIRLRLADTPELGNLPWEFIYDPSLNRFLALSIETPLVRYLETSQVIQPLNIKPPLRILAMICGPIDFPKLDVEREWENLQESLSSLQSRGLVHLQRLTPPTLSSLQQHLRREQYHIFHFIGHGVFSKRDQDGFLLLENEQRSGHRLSGRDLGTLLHDHRPLRLAVLNACEGARASLDDQFAGTAQSLIQQGIPAVIAMQFRITDQASITLAHEFYGSLADGYPVDAALTEARKAIKTQGNELEWGTPVLYMRSPDGRIFDVAQMPAEVTPPRSTPTADPQETARLERLYTEALETFYLGNWEQAHQKFQAIVDAQPDNKDAVTKLEISRQKMRLQNFNEQALAAEKAGDWDQAIQSLEELIAEDATSAEASARLAKARRQKQLSNLYTEAQRLAQAEKWRAVLGIFQEIERIDPRYPDPQGLRAKSQNNQVKVKRESEVEKAYADGLHAIDSNHWQEAIRHLRRVRGLQAGYRETDQLLRRAESEIERARKEKSKPQSVPDTPTMNYEWLILAMFAGFGLSRAIPEILIGGPFFTWIEENSNTYTAFAIYIPIFGVLLGFTLWWVLRKAGTTLTHPQILAIIITPAITATILSETAFYIYATILQVEWVWTVMYTGIGLSIGILLSVIFRKNNPAFTRKQFLFTIFGWGFAFYTGQMTQQIYLSYNLGQIIYNERVTNVIAYSLEAGIAGLIGGFLMVGQLRIIPNLHINWKTVLAGALGFSLSNLLVNILFASSGDELNIRVIQFLIWGFLACASLAYPSKEYKRYLALGLLGSIGMAGGQWLWLALGETDSSYSIILGGLLGLFLGIYTKRISGVLILLLFSVIAYIMRYTFDAIYYNSSISQTPAFELTVLALTAGLLGSIIAMVLSLMRSEESS